MFKFSFQTAEELAARLHITKKNYNLTQNQIAKAIGVTPTTVSSWLNGKRHIGPQYKEAVENFIAKTWQPGIICVWNPNKSRKGQFLLVGDIYDPFYTWINNNFDEEDEKYLEELERELETGKATFHLVKKYINMDEANEIGRDEEHQYNFGAMTNNPNAICHFIKPGGKIIDKPALIYEPKL